MIKTILASTDGSVHADKAVGLAGDLAGKYGARLVILHALMHHESAGDLRSMCERLGAPAELLAQIEAEAEAMVSTMASAYAEVPVIMPMSGELLQSIGRFVCDKAGKTAREHGATDVTVSLVSGAPAEAILGAAKHEEADMIVMGSRGLGRFRGLLFGAVSQRVNHLAECTCVTVK